MHRVVLVAIHARYTHSALAVWALAAGVSRYAQGCHAVEIVESTIHCSPAETARQIAAHAPSVVGLSCYIWNARLLPALIDELRRILPGTVLVLGGPEVSHNPFQWLERGADYVLCGEGEQSFPMLLDRLSRAGDLAQVPGLCRLIEGKMASTPQQPPRDEWTDPYSPAYFASLQGRMAYLETARGCPFSCAFCLSGESALRFTHLAEAERQLLRLAQSGTRTVKLVDRTFNSNPRRAYQLFAYVIAMDTPVCFHFELAADLLDEDTLSLLGTAPPGRIQLEIGLQSFHEPTLEAVSRKSCLTKAAANIRTLLAAGNIHIHVDLIAGLPYETLALFEESFNCAYALGAHQLQLGFLKLLHGSALRRQAADWGIQYDPEPPYEITQSPWISPADLHLLKQAETGLGRVHNKGRMLRTLHYLLTASGLSPFRFFVGLGQLLPGHGQSAEWVVSRLYDYGRTLPGVRETELRDYLVCDRLAALGGENLPEFLQIRDKRRKKAAKQASQILGRTMRRCETALLASETGKAVFVDKGDRDPVTGLYRLQYIDITE